MMVRKVLRRLLVALMRPADRFSGSLEYFDFVGNTLALDLSPGWINAPRLTLRGMRTMGLGLPAADEDAFLHAWNVVGHVLGVQTPRS